MPTYRKKAAVVEGVGWMDSRLKGSSAWADGQRDAGATPEAPDQHPSAPRQTPAGAPPGDILCTAESVTVRRRELLAQQIVRRRPRKVPRRGEKGVVIIIPTHNDRTKDRVRLLKNAVASICNQIRDGFDEFIHVIIADNGLTTEQRADVFNVLTMLRNESRILESELQYHIVDAAPQFSFQRSPSFARNAGLNYAIAKNLTGTFVLMDDDAAMLRGTLPRLLATIREFNAAAVVPTGVPIGDMDAGYEQLRRSIHPRDGECRAMPSLLTDEFGFDIGSVVAFSSLVGTKTALACLSGEVVREIVEHSGALFALFPGLSMEDMIATAVIQQYGTVYHSPVRFLDHLPEVEAVVFRQKARWGWDHGLAMRDLVAIGALTPGVHVLEPLPGSNWLQKTVRVNAAYPLEHGVVVNPSGLKQTARILSDLVERDRLQLGPEFSKDLLEDGLLVVDSVLERLDEQRAPSVSIERTDLPVLSERDKSHLRWRREADAYQLAGNLRALSDPKVVNQASGSVFLFGTRQPAQWI